MKFAALRNGLIGMFFAASPFMAAAAPFDDNERDNIIARLIEIEPVAAAGDIAATIGVMPPAIIGMLAQSANTTTEILRDGIIADLQATMVGVSIESYNFDYDAVSFFETPQGMPYALVPTAIVMKVQGNSARINAMTIALIEDDTVYLALLDEPDQIALFKTAYPAFSEIEVPTGTMEIIR